MFMRVSLDILKNNKKLLINDKIILNTSKIIDKIEKL